MLKIGATKLGKVGETVGRAIDTLVFPVADHALGVVCEGETFSYKKLLTQLVVNFMFGVLKADFKKYRF